MMPSQLRYKQLDVGMGTVQQLQCHPRNSEEFAPPLSLIVGPHVLHMISARSMQPRNQTHSVWITADAANNIMLADAGEPKKGTSEHEQQPEFECHAFYHLQ